MADGTNKLFKFWQELKRRKVVRVVVIYASAAFILLQLVNILVVPLKLPIWVLTFSIILLAVGFPIAAIIAWIFEVSPQGIKLNRPEKNELEINPVSQPKDKMYFTYFFKNRKYYLILIIIIVISVLAFGLYNSYGKKKNREYVRSELLPELWKIVTDNQNTEEGFNNSKYWFIFNQLFEAEKSISEDSGFIETKYKLTQPVNIVTHPPGVKVYGKSYMPSDTSWHYFGISPLYKIVVPIGISVLKLEKEDYQSYFDVLAIIKWWEKNKYDTLNYTLTLKNEADENMVLIPGYWIKPNMNEIRYFEYQEIGDFWMDKFEVTNKQYKKFIDDGGYRITRYWKYVFKQKGKQLKFDDAIELFKDKTGRYGPSLWIAGSYPDGEDNFPVSGISWYEAAAFAEYCGKSLPTIYHWSAVIDRDLIPIQVKYSNINGKSIAATGTFPGIGKYGLYDIIGNVREWIFNKTGNNNYVFGGSVNDPTYRSVLAYSRDPWERDEFTGFRCIKYLNDSNKINLEREFDYTVSDWSNDKPVSDEVFKTIIKRYEYDQSPVVIKSLKKEKFNEWNLEIATIDPVYDGSELDIYVYLPNNASPPYQSVIIFPGRDAENDLPGNVTNYPSRCSFLLKSGRAIIFPRYFDTYGRGTNSQKGIDRLTKVVKDLKRTLDYWESRPDMDTSKIAYYGISWGGWHSPYFLGIEKRIKLGMINAYGAFGNDNPELHAQNYLHRVTCPMLMMNGKYDFDFPYESQLRYYNWLGTTKENKKWILYETTHGGPQIEIQKETINWLDKYFGNALNQ